MAIAGASVPSGVKNVTDDKVAAVSPSVTYQVTAIRSTPRGNPGQFTVSFGMGGGGGFAITGVTEGTGSPVKMAA
ncbi:MAG: hypothetical protein AMXMBFR58_01730 [Phycisphaerae bacterium]